MLIKYLKIEKNEELLRCIKFKMGVNLIVDTTTLSDNKKESGNNVGKTTVLRLVDYCLGGEAQTIYKDLEFKTHNRIVENFLKDNNVVITLCLGRSFDNELHDILLRRNFLEGNQLITEINGENLKIKKYRNRLNQLLFNLSSPKPTFRQLIARFIRSDSLRMDNVIKYLHSTTTDNTYEGIYYFLFNNFDAKFSTEKDELNKNLHLNKRIINERFLKRSRSVEEIKQHLSLINHELGELETQKQNFNINPQYAKEYSELQNIKSIINSASSNLLNKQFRLKLLTEKIEGLQKKSSEIDRESLKMLYEEAKHYIPALQKSFDDALLFHNKLIANQLVYLSEDIPTLEKEAHDLKEQLDLLLNSERELGNRLIKTGALGDYELIVSAANKKYEQKGRLEEELEKLQNIQSAIDKDNTRIAEINNIISSEASELENNITKLNQVFSSYSEKLYDEKFVLSATFDHKKNVYKFHISSMDGNLGDGKKKGLIAAFDLAYITYANDKGFNRPFFAMHDIIETVHCNQLKSLFDLVNSKQFNGQYIASVLSGKFSETGLTDNYLDANKIIELSQTDKLFKIESHL